MNERSCRKRIYIVFMLFVMMFILLIGKIVVYQHLESSELKTMADNQYHYKERLRELNYSLLDYNGKDLLKYFNEYYAVIDPYSFKLNNYYTNKSDLYALNIILRNYNKEYDIDKLNFKNINEKIKFKIDEVTYNELSKIKGIKGFYTYNYLKINRDSGWWNVENLITNIYKINSKGENEEKSEDSIENRIREKTKENEFIYNIFKKDVNGNIYNKYMTEPKNNVHIRLTLDKYLQDSIKDILNEDDYSMYSQIGVVLMESNTGKIKAMVQKDDFKPNVNLGVSTNNGFFPGSIFKVVVEGAGLETGKISLSEKYHLNSNLDKRYRGHETKESMNSSEALIQSSNDIYAQIGIKVGIESIKDFSERQGLTKKVLNFDEEVEGNFEGYDSEVGDLELTAFGQKQRITPIEAISIPNTVVNKGIYVKPYLIDAYVDENNTPIESFTTKEESVMSADVANSLKNQMIQVVTSTYGTGKEARIETIEVGGKTGTAERLEEKNIFYDGWFAGFFKVDKEYYSMIVFVEDIGYDMSAGNTAAPIFKKIIEKTYNYLNKI